MGQNVDANVVNGTWRTLFPSLCLGAYIKSLFPSQWRQLDSGGWCRAMKNRLLLWIALWTRTYC